MYHQWERFIYWLGQGQNAAAVQGIVGLISSFLTMGLFVVTYRYVKLTNVLAKTAQGQLRAMFQPSLRLRAKRGECYPYVYISIQNETNIPVYLEKNQSHLHLFGYRHMVADTRATSNASSCCACLINV
jgi:hypothetical protein